MFFSLDQLEGYYYYHWEIEKVQNELPNGISLRNYKNQMFFMFRKGEMLSNFFQRQVIAQSRQGTLDQQLVQYFILAHH